MSDQPPNLLDTEWFQLERSHRTFTLHVGKEVQQRMRGQQRQFGITTGHDKGDWIAVKLTRQVPKQITTTMVGPLNIIQNNQQWCTFAGSDKQIACSFPQP